MCNPMSRSHRYPWRSQLPSNGLCYNGERSQEADIQEEPPGVDGGESTTAETHQGTTWPLDRAYGRPMEKCKYDFHQHLALRRGQKEDRQVSWDGVPYLFKPGAEVVMPQAFLDEPQLFHCRALRCIRELPTPGQGCPRGNLLVL
jgi:hypothetical protein